MHLLYSAMQIVLLEQLYWYTILQYSIELYYCVCLSVFKDSVFE